VNPVVLPQKAQAMKTLLSRLLHIEHTPWSYRGDFIVHMAAILLLAALLAWAAPPAQRAPLGIAAAVAALSWSLIEYIVHRFILHGVQPFRRWHAAHHSQPRALICTPLLLSATLVGTLVFLPAWLLSDRWQATALTLGLLVGYLVYALTHHAIHHSGANGLWLRQRKLCHALHHGAGRPPGYYGVTSRLWDDIMGTAHEHDY